MIITPNQERILTILMRGTNVRGDRNCDIYQLLEGLEKTYGWKTTRDSMQFSLRALRRRGLVAPPERRLRKGRIKSIHTLTTFGKQIMSSVKSADFEKASGKR